MAKNRNIKFAKLTNFVLIVALLLIVSNSMVESREIGFVKEMKSSSTTPVCTAVHAVAVGETCDSVTKALSLTTEFFNSINPNLPCDSLFVGQWLCVAGGA